MSNPNAEIENGLSAISKIQTAFCAADAYFEWSSGNGFSRSQLMLVLEAVDNDVNVSTTTIRYNRNKLEKTLASQNLQEFAQNCEIAANFLLTHNAKQHDSIISHLCQRLTSLASDVNITSTTYQHDYFSNGESLEQINPLSVSLLWKIDALFQDETGSSMKYATSLINFLKNL